MTEKVAPLSDRHNQMVCHLLRQEGRETTPQEVGEERRKAYAKIRQEMRERGETPPATDEEMFWFLSEQE